MNDMRSEEEQVEALRQWWKENGTGVVTAVLLAIAGGFGWQAWQAHQKESQELASDTYQAMMRMIDVGEESGRDQVMELAQGLKSEHSGTTYAQYAAMQLAALAVQEGNLDEAEKQLRWVLAKADKGSDNAIVAQQRLARVVFSLGDTEQALSLLNAADAGNYAASYAIARGDILYSRGELEAAREAYNEALLLNAAGGAPVNVPSLQQKLQSLAALDAQTQSAAESDLFGSDEPEGQDVEAALEESPVSQGDTGQQANDAAGSITESDSEAPAS